MSRNISALHRNNLVAPASGGIEGGTSNIPWFEREENCGRYDFNKLCKKFERCEVDKTLKLEDKIKLIFDLELSELCQWQSFYPLMRLVVPENDGRNYGMNSKKLAQRFASQVLRFDPKKGGEYEAVTDANSPLDSSMRIYTQLLKRDDLVHVSKKTIRDINDILDRLNEADTPEESSNILREVYKNYTAFEQKWICRIIVGDMKTGIKNAASILNRIDEGATNKFNTDHGLRNIGSWIAERSYKKANPNKDGTAVNQSTIVGELKAGCSFGPMLAKKCGQSEGLQTALVNMVASEPFVCDEKMDGERMCFHKNGNTVKLITRNFADYTTNYIGLVDCLTDLCNTLGIDEVILDGEVLTWDTEKEAYVSFGSNPTTALSERNALMNDLNDVLPGDQKEKSVVPPTMNKAELRFVAFDCVYINTYSSTNTPSDMLKVALSDAIASRRISISKAKEYVNEDGNVHFSGGDITKLPLCIRRSLLSRIVVEGKRKLSDSERDKVGERIVLVNCKDFPYQEHRESLSMPPPAQIVEEVYGYFGRIIDDNGEGLVVKRWDSEYLCGSANRAKGQWLKMKPDHELGGGICDMDVAILGAYYGKGKRSTQFGSFLVGLREDSNQDGDVDVPPANVKYIAFGKIGSGFTDKQRLDFQQYVEESGKGLKNTTIKQWRQDGAFDGYEQYTLTSKANGIKKSDDWPDVLLPPGNTMVCKCAAITASQTFPSAITMRFPRCTSFRTDKPPPDIMTLNEARIQMNSQILADKVKSLVDGSTGGKKQSKSRRQLQDSPQLLTKSDALDGTKTFKNLTFCVDTSGSFAAKRIISSPLANAATINVPYLPTTNELEENSPLWCTMYSERSCGVFGDVSRPEFKAKLEKLVTKEHANHKGGAKGSFNENLQHPVTGARGTHGWTFGDPYKMRPKIDEAFNINLKDGQSPVLRFYQNPNQPWKSGTMTSFSQNRQSIQRIMTETSVAAAAARQLATSSPSSLEVTADTMKTLISEHGGNLEESPASNTTVMVVGPRRPFSVKVTNHIRSSDIDIVSHEWIIASISRAKQNKKLSSFLKEPSFLIAPSQVSIDKLATIQKTDFGERLGREISPSGAGILCYNATSYAGRIANSAKSIYGKSAEARSQLSRTSVIKEDLKVLRNGNGFLPWRDIAIKHLSILPNLGLPDSAIHDGSGVVMKGHPPLWDINVVVWSINNSPPHDDTYHDMFVASMRALGCNVSLSGEVDKKRLTTKTFGAITHILVPPTLEDSILEGIKADTAMVMAKEKNGKKRRRIACPVVVNTSWAESCLREERLVDVREHLEPRVPPVASTTSSQPPSASGTNI
jgi:ATP-dependent DNA ligase